MLRRICRRRKAWKADKPSADDIAELWRKFPATTVLTVSRAAAQEINVLSVEVLFQRQGQQLLATLPGDFESNPLNYIGGDLRRHAELRPLELSLIHI
eukprot:2289154-Prorocentrum_lima.AAC.1